ncbi:MAG: hypothetical protein Q7R62_02980 [bacterium]|nr:hypothetical protein [bacterium]
MQPIGPTSTGSSKRGFLKFIIAFVAIILVGYVGYVVAYNIQHWDEIQQVAKLQEDMEAWKDIYRNDKAGGSTPQETLDLFIVALEKNDVELATSYFMPDDYGSREKWRKVLQDTKDDTGFEAAIVELKSSKPEPAGIIGDGSKFYAFSALDSNGMVDLYVILQFNGNFWKIDSL